MRKLYLLIICSMFIVAAHAQPINWLWSRSSGGAGNENARSVCTDPSGNVYATGYFTSTSVTFGSTTLVNADNTASYNDYFIVKYDASGNVLWAQRAGGTSEDYGEGLATDAAGNVYVTGSFKGASITFGSIILNNSGINSTDYFVVKYDPAGNVIWATSEGGSNYDNGMSLALDVTGNLFVMGNFLSPTFTIGTTTLSNAGTNADVFIAKYDTSGNVLWARRGGGTNADLGLDICTDPSGNVCVSGYFVSSTITFGSTTITNTTNGMREAFVVKYDTNGNLAWLNTGKGIGWDEAFAICSDANGNIFIAGDFESTQVIFGTDTLNNFDSNQNEDAFIVKYDAAGNEQWARSVSGNTWEVSQGITCDVLGNVYHAGGFHCPSLVVGGDTLQNANPAGNSLDIFIIKYDGAGNILWTDREGGTAPDNVYDIFMDGGNSLYVCGSFFSPTVNFGTTTVTNSWSTSDLFVAKADVMTGIENQPEGSFLVYPNPATGQFTIDRGGDYSDVAVTIYDLAGRIVYANSFTGMALIPVELNAPAGMYLVQMISEERETFTRIIIE